MSQAAICDHVTELRDARGNDPFFPLKVRPIVFSNQAEAEIDEQVAQSQGDVGPGQVVKRPAFDVAAVGEAVKTSLRRGVEENICDPKQLTAFFYTPPDIGEALAKVRGLFAPASHPARLDW
jgi:hypothetical protein